MVILCANQHRKAAYFAHSILVAVSKAPLLKREHYNLTLDRLSSNSLLFLFFIVVLGGLADNRIMGTSECDRLTKLALI